MGYGYYVIGGKECGYAVEDTCNQEGCTAVIDRGLAYACGGTPGEVDEFCDGYFCGEHLFFVEGSRLGGGEHRPMCGKCVAFLEEAERDFKAEVEAGQWTP